jgi:uncharacterized protein with HEPN domain
MKGQLSDKLRIQHILDAIDEVKAYTTGVTKDAFLENSEKRFATIKQIEIVGEACNKITDDTKLSFQDVPWREIIGFRNISIHEYHNVSFHIVWEIAVEEFPPLKKQFEEILKTLTEE